MNGLKMRRPTPALVIAMIALFVALGGTAGAVVTAAVPLAKRALVADNAKRALVADNSSILGPSAARTRFSAGTGMSAASNPSRNERMAARGLR